MKIYKLYKVVNNSMKLYYIKGIAEITKLGIINDVKLQNLNYVCE